MQKLSVTSCICSAQTLQEFHVDRPGTFKRGSRWGQRHLHYELSGSGTGSNETAKACCAMALAGGNVGRDPLRFVVGAPVLPAARLPFGAAG